MLEIGILVAILIAIVLIKNKIQCNRYICEAKIKADKRKKDLQDRLDAALERSIR